MKTFLRIIDILLVAAVVALGFSAAAGSVSAAGGPGEGTQRPAMNGTAGEAFQPTQRFGNGDHAGASLTGGLAGVLGTAAKLAVITILVLLVQKAASLISQRRVISLPQPKLHQP